MKKLRSPYFVSVELLKDGTAKLVDDDGETYHVEMDRRTEWPIMSRRTRNREMRATSDKIAARENAPPPPIPFKPRVV